MKRRVLLAAGFLLAACGMVHAQDEQPGQLRRLNKAGDYTVGPGDLIVVALQSNPSIGPANPAANLKVETKGTGLGKTYVVFAPPARPIPGAAGEIQAYVPVDAVGSATLTVTPVNGRGQPGAALVFNITIDEDAL